MSPEDFQHQLRDVIARRDSEEARALQLLLMARIDRRVMGVLRRRTHGVVTDAEREELVGEVMLQLLRGSLAAFRGHTFGSKRPGAVGVMKARPMRKEAVHGFSMDAIIEKKPLRARPTRIDREVPCEPSARERFVCMTRGGRKCVLGFRSSCGGLRQMQLHASSVVRAAPCGHSRSGRRTNQIVESLQSLLVAHQR